MTSKKKRSVSIALCVVKIILSILLLCLFSIRNSPFAKGCYGYDVSYYNVIGRMINAGRIPYRDFYDVKGPIFLYWQTLGQIISSDRWGAFILECVLMAVCVVLLHYIGEAVSLEYSYDLILFAVYQYVFIKSFWGSCSVEEFTMPGNLFSLYCAIRALRIRQTDLDRIYCKPVSFFVIGLFFGVALFSKITTAAPMCASLAFVLIIFIIDKLYKQVLRGLLLFFAGSILVTLLVVVYFVYIHNLNNMLMWAFVKAVSRGVNKDPCVDGGFILRSVLIVFFVVYALVRIHKKTAGLMEWFLLMLSMAAFITIQIGDRWSYYYLQLLPTIVLFMILFFEDLRKVKNDGFVVLELTEKKARIHYLLMSFACVVFCGFSFCGNLSDNTPESFDSVFKSKYSHMDDDFEKITSLIPPQEREGVFCLEKGVCYFDAAGINPANKVPGFVSTFTDLDEMLTDKRLFELNSVKPKWIVSKDVENYEMPAIMDALRQEYILVFKNTMGFELWKRE